MFRPVERRRCPLWGAGWGALLLAQAAACDTPAVDARVMWIDGEHVRGMRTIHIYSRGEIETMTIRPRGALDGQAESVALDSERESLVLDLSARGGSALVMASDPKTILTGRSTTRIAVLDLQGRRTLGVDVPAGSDAPTPVLSALGDAVTWVDPCAHSLAILPFGGGVTASQIEDGERVLAPWTVDLDEDDPEPADLSCALRWGTASAVDAPVVFVGDGALLGGALRPVVGAEIRAYRYALSGGEELAVELGRGALRPDVDNGRPPGCASAVNCLGLVDPDGEALSVIGAEDEPCRIQRWSWVPQENEAGELVVEPARCVWSGEGDVVAAISGRHYVIVRENEVIRLDWTTGEEVGLPLLGGGARWSWHLDPEGRAVSMVSTAGPMLRIGTGGVELVNIVQTLCSFGQEPIVSPSGRWAAWSCFVTEDGDEEGAGVALNTVIRASVAGLERYEGVPMWAVAIDDGGELLLYSRADSSLNDARQPVISPRNLYVLGGDGELSRVDTLEPDPELTRDVNGEVRWMVAAPL